MGRRFTRLEGPDAAATVTPRLPLWNGAVDLAAVLFLPLTTQPAGSREVVLPGRRPEFPPRAGDTLKPWNDEVTKYGGMP